MSEMTREKALEVLEDMYRDDVRDAEMYRREILKHPNTSDSMLLLHGVCQEEAEVMAYAIAAIKREKEIVRCRNCRFRDATVFPFGGDIICRNDHRNCRMKPDDYCCFGEEAEHGE